MTEQNKALQQLIEQHQRNSGVTPPEHLWAQLETRLTTAQNANENGTSNSWLAAGFGAMAASVLAVAIFLGYQPTTKQEAQPVSDWFYLAEQMNQAQRQQVSALQNGYQLAGFQLEQPQLQQQLTELRQARQQLTQSLQENGGNAQIIDMLRWINAEEIELLNQLYQQPSTLREL